MSSNSVVRIKSIIIKETRQIVRDPSSILIAFVLPAILLVLFAYGINMDAKKIALGIAMESSDNIARQVVKTFQSTPYFDVTVATDRRALQDLVIKGDLRGLVVIPQDFSERLVKGSESPIMVITDGSETNTASFVRNYASGVLKVWENNESRADGNQNIRLLTRYWFNAELESKNALVPGSLAIIMSIVGTLLTSLVVAREWERGTMESMLSTPITPLEMLIGKTIPYLALGFISLVGSVIMAIALFGVPFRGGVAALLLCGTSFLLCALGQGFLISTASKNQFVASQVALITAFLPAFLLSGFIFEIASMPFAVRQITGILPAKYLVTNLQTIFLVGDIWPVIIPNVLFLLVISVVFLGITLKKSSSTLEGIK